MHFNEADWDLPDDPELRCARFLTIRLPNLVKKSEGKVKKSEGKVKEKVIQK